LSYIGRKPTVGNFQICDAISVVNGQAAYTMQVGSVNVIPQSANHMIVSLNGTIQKPNSSFTVSGSTITFASNLATGDVIDFIQILGDVLDLGVPSDATVTSAKLASTSVTAAKLNNDIISGTTALTSEPADTDEFLVSDAGTLKRIDYSLIKGGGEWTKILHTTASADTTVAFNSTYITSTYQDYKVVFSNVHASEDQRYFTLYISTDNGSSDTNVDSANRLFKDDDHVSSRSQTNSANFRLHGNEYVGNAAGETISGFIEIFDPSATDTRTHIIGRSIANIGDAANAHYNSLLGASTLTTTAVNYIKFGWTAGNIASGEFTLYGRKI